MKVEIPEFTQEDYLDSTAPYEWLYSHRNPLEQKQLCARMAERAAAVGVRRSEEHTS